MVKHYATISADPPWPFGDQGSRMAPNYSGKGRKKARYKTMTLDDICAMPVQKLAAHDAYLWLWCPNALVLDGSATLVARAWGFEPKQMIPWIKTDKKGRPRLGGGHHTRVVSETLILCTRRSPKALHRDQPGLLEEPLVAERQGHSAKPPCQYPLIERVSRGPRLELFARGEPRRGWDAWGDQTRCAPAAVAVLGRPRRRRA